MVKVITDGFDYNFLKKIIANGTIKYFFNKKSFYKYSKKIINKLFFKSLNNVSPVFRLEAWGTR